MMINKRLINTVEKSKKYICLNVLFQWCSLICNMIMIFAMAFLLDRLRLRMLDKNSLFFVFILILVCVLLRYLCAIGANRQSFLASKSVKHRLRNLIYQKCLRLGSGYTQDMATSEIVQVSVEGVEQLETYFGSYLPQFFYSMLAPLTLFIALSFISLKAALVLLICVPLIPISIALVQSFAKKLLSRYWGQYTALGDSFLENLQGLTTLKIYQADGWKNEQMNEEAEKFRKITMRVLTMQLNSITIMDIVAFGGAALGIIVALSELKAGNVDFFGCFSIIMLSADFFIPMRTLGSFFHIAMNGMAASEKIFKCLDLAEPADGHLNIDPLHCDIEMENVDFSYDGQRPILKNVSMKFSQGKFTAIVGESGCGKSSIVSLLMRRNCSNEERIMIGCQPLTEIKEADLMNQVTLVTHHSYLFKGSVKENLLMAAPQASDECLWAVLEKCKLADFLKNEQGLDTMLNEKASNLSGGQAQRLALARALLHDSAIYIFDEATSNIDVESENAIMEVIEELAKKKLVILISHRLANVKKADQIYVMEHGEVVEAGNHSTLIKNKGCYAQLVNQQMELEDLGGNWNEA